MSEKENLNCEQARDQLDLLIEAMVDARIQAEADLSRGTPEGSEKYKLEQNAFEPAGPLKDHLGACTECHNYQLANRVVIEAARALPKIAADEALTESIMAMIQASQEAELASSNQLVTRDSTPSIQIMSASSATAASPAVASISKQALPKILSLQNPYGMAATFLVFTLIVSTTAGFTDEAIWSACSWALALLLVALLKPLVEGKSGFASTTPTTAKA